MAVLAARQTFRCDAVHTPALRLSSGAIVKDARTWALASTPGRKIRGNRMDTRIDEIADSIYRISLYNPTVAPPAGLTYNVFLIAGDEPLLFHTGRRSTFSDVAAAIARVMPL